MLRIFSAPAAILGLLAIAHLPATLAKPYPVHVEEFREVHNASQVIDKRQCAGTLCGWAQQLCCPSGTQCYTDANNQAQCGAGSGSGTWQYYTTTYVETVGLLTKTSVYSSYVGGAAPTATCKSSQNPCGSKCCDSGFYCADNANGGTCAAFGGGSSGGILPTVAPGTLQPSAPLRPTSSGLVIVTYTGRPTATVPFQTPIPTGAQGSPMPVAGGGGGGLSLESCSVYSFSPCSASSAAHVRSSTRFLPSSVLERTRSTRTRRLTLKSTVTALEAPLLLVDAGMVKAALHVHRELAVKRRAASRRLAALPLRLVVLRLSWV
jgi:hypothetical protein